MNKNLISTKNKTSAPPANTTNEAGGRAYSMTDENALAQYAVTGCFNGVFYASAQTQLDQVKAFAAGCSDEFLAKTAVYARKEGFMKDMPAFLLATLAARNTPSSRELLARAFPLVCDDAKMIKNFVQVIRSGVTGRKSFGSQAKRLIQNWLESRTEEQLFNASVGNDPSLVDVIKMVHPKPKTAARNAFYKYLLGKELTPAVKARLPKVVRDYEAFKKNKGEGDVPDVNFQLLTNLNLNVDQYRQVAEGMSWSALRQNLNALAKNGVFNDAKFTKKMAAKLADPEAVRKAKAMPYQLFMSYTATDGLPEAIRNALQDAMEAALSNVPELEGDSYVVAVDNSGSMSSPVTGYNGTATSKVSCLDAAAVMGSALLRTNPNKVTMLAFNTDVVRNTRFNGRDSVITNVEKLKALPGGGTDCSSVLRDLNRINAKADAVIYLSDNESWLDGSYRGSYWGQGSTSMADEWEKFKKRNPAAKLVCIDIAAYATTQVTNKTGERLNVGGFSDSVFKVVGNFLSKKLTSGNFADTIKKVEL